MYLSKFGQDIQPDVDFITISESNQTVQYVHQI